MTISTQPEHSAPTEVDRQQVRPTGRSRLLRSYLTVVGALACGSPSIIAAGLAIQHSDHRSWVDLGYMFWGAAGFLALAVPALFVLARGSRLGGLWPVLILVGLALAVLVQSYLVQGSVPVGPAIALLTPALGSYLTDPEAVSPAP